MFPHLDAKSNIQEWKSVPKQCFYKQVFLGYTLHVEQEKSENKVEIKDKKNF